MGFAAVVTPAPRTTPTFNIGCLLDIITGFPVRGMKGETIINGGLHQLNGGTGEANSAKTGFQLYQCLTVVSRYKPSSLVIYDAEKTLPRERIVNQAKFIAPDLVTIETAEDGTTYEELDRIAISTPSEYRGDEFYAAFKEYGENRPKLKADYINTPIKDAKSGKPISILAPDIAFIDSFSKFSTGATEKIQDEADIGDSKQNTLFLKDGLVKTQMMNEIPNIASKYGLYFVMTAQIGENKQLDPYKAPRETLSFLKNGLKLKRVPDDYRYYMHNLWFNFKMKALLNSGTKAPEYPKNSEENQAKGDTDLQEIVVINLRGKSGASGKPISILFSQSEGIKASLTEFHFIKTEGFGLEGSAQNYALSLYPDVKLSRTTVRTKIDEDAKLRTAIKLTSDLLQITQEWRFLPPGLICDAKTLYEDIKAKGYDWDVLLQSRSYWTFDQYENPLPFLSIMDLLYMREGSYTPYWLEKK